MNKQIATLWAVVVLILVGCSTRGFRPPPEPWEEFEAVNRSVTFDEVKNALEFCGDLKEYGYAGPPGKRTRNDVAQRMECMFAKGYVFKSGWGGICSDPGSRDKLPACKDAPIRPRYR